MSILNRGWIYDSITRNQDSGSVPYRWTHGANDLYMGSGIFYYAIPYFLKAEVCVCLGSGGGFVPHIMSQARLELWKDQTVGGQEQYEFAVSFMKIGDYETAEFALKEFIDKNKDKVHV